MQGIAYTGVRRAGGVDGAERPLEEPKQGRAFPERWNL